jgi:asparagine synthase (glutamine-hydrolysing)
MCGIAGKFHFDLSARIETSEIERMLNVMSHRGPDGRGAYLGGSVGLGHLRLSIIDLSTGAQPLSNEDGSVWIVFNGEIYNYPELRKRLLSRGHQFKTATDTEVIVHLYEERAEECVHDLRGMFAFAIWDRPRQRLFLARDRVGIKPLYYCQHGDTLWFASESKALLTDPAVPRDIDLGAVCQFLAHYYLPGEQTLFQGVRRLLPGHTLTVENGSVSRRKYWDLEFPAEPSRCSFEQAADELRELLRRRVLDHMISDVPVGFLASGGVDSTALLSFASQQTDKPIQTFTVGFDDEHFADERPYARMAAERFGARHHEISMSAEQFGDFLPDYVWHMEDPVCEPPAVALHYVTRMARRHVKVLLSGEGGDEAFGGYQNYRNQLFLDLVKKVAGPGRIPLGRALAALNSGKPGRLGYYSRALAADLGEHYWSRTSSPWTYFNATSNFFAESFLDGSPAFHDASFMHTLHHRVRHLDTLSRMLYVDTKSWLPDDLLIKADKITMGNSLELRVPLLDHTVLEFAARLPSNYKVRGLETKRVLKRAFQGVVPQEILDRKKTGFPVPYERWLRNELRSFVQETVCSDRAIARGYFKANALKKLIEVDAADGGLSKEVFCLLTLELWHQRFVDAPVAGAECPNAELSAALD